MLCVNILNTVREGVGRTAYSLNKLKDFKILSEKQTNVLIYNKLYMLFNIYLGFYIITKDDRL